MISTGSVSLGMVHRDKGIHTGDDARRAVTPGCKRIGCFQSAVAQLDGVGTTLRILPKLFASVAIVSRSCSMVEFRRGAIC